MTIYYISTTGNDANDGSSGSPFATVTAANAVVQPGDTVYFKAGTYHNATFGDGNIWKGGLDVVMRINSVNGTAEAPITYAAEPGATVKIKYDGSGAIRLQDSTYIKIEGFDIEGPNGSITLQEALDHQFTYRIDANANGNLADETDHIRNPAATLTQTVASEGGERALYYNSNAISVGNGSNHIQIINNKIHDSTGHAIASLGGADYVTVRGNEIYNNTWYSSNGNHAVSFKGVTSSDALDIVKIVVDGNTFTDNHNLLISWSSLKTAPVDMVIDEGKSIHVQLARAVDGFTDGWIQISNNIILRAGNAAITVNDGERVIIANNTIVDAGDLNNLITAGLADPKAEAGFTVAAGGFRLANGQDIKVINNLILVSDQTLNVVDAVASIDPTTAIFAGNFYSGGTGLYLRSTASNIQELAQGFTAVADLGFQNRANNNFHLLVASPALNGGSEILESLITADFSGMLRDTVSMDAGAYEGDVTAPTISSVSPPNNEAAFLVNSDLTFTFSELVRKGTGTANIKTRSGAIVESFDLATSPAATFSGNGLNINPALDLATSTAYTIELSQGSVLDAAGNPLTTLAPLVFTTAPFHRYFNGTAAPDTFVGSGLNDFLQGSSGLDNLNGGAGSDLYYVFASSEHAAAEFRDTGTSGMDTIRFASTSAGTLKLFAGDTGIERVIFGTGTAAVANSAGTQALNVDASLVKQAMLFYGNAGNNIIRGGLGLDRMSGGAGADTLSGNAGADYLYGGLGHDRLTGGTGIDRFIFNSASPAAHSDIVTDFRHGSDRVALDDAVFKALGHVAKARLISSSEFVQGRNYTQAKDASDNIIYNTESGALYYDADGLGGANSVKFANLGTTASHPASLSYLDFWVY